MRGNRLGLLMAIFLFGSFPAAVVIPSSPAAEPKPATLVFACSADNDLFRAVSAGNEAGATPFPRFETAAESIPAAPDGAGVLILAGGS